MGIRPRRARSPHTRRTHGVRHRAVRRARQHQCAAQKAQAVVQAMETEVFDRMATKRGLIVLDTNNTSLVLAFELLPSRRVLLFPGDAQVGNWLSWQDVRWSVTDAGGAREVTAADLLSRTI